MGPALLLALAGLWAGARSSVPGAAAPAPEAPAPTTAEPPASDATAPDGTAAASRVVAARWQLEVISSHPHDPLAHTEGLVSAGEGQLFESEGKSYPDGRGGLDYRSSLRLVDLASGRVQLRADRQDHWAEGLAVVGDQLIQLSLDQGRASVYDSATFARRADQIYEGQPGWGLCHDGTSLWMSDGSAFLSRRDPATLAVLGSIRVVLDGAPLLGLNELECQAGRIYANLFPSGDGERDRIAVIDPANGAVQALVDASGLLSPAEQAAAAELNGIAALSAGRFALTGKLWPRLYVVRFLEDQAPSPSPTATPAPTAIPLPAQLQAQVLATYPHDGSCYTQGLVWDDGRVFESCGLYQQSRIREVELSTGRSIREQAVPDLYFAEGLALVDQQLFQLTWRGGFGFIWNRDDFSSTETFSYPTEGWGLCHDGRRLVQSDGSGRLSFYSPDPAYRPQGFVDVLRHGETVDRLNELECVDGLVWSNVYLTNWIYRIDPAQGRVTGVLDLSALVPPLDVDPSLFPVLNGIAYDAADNSYLVTGKLWPVLYRLRIHERPPLILPLLTRGH